MVNLNFTCASLALLGCGQMGSALLRAWLNQNLLNAALVIEPHALAADLINSAVVSHKTSICALPPACDALVLAIKPQSMEDAAKSMAGMIPQDTLLISIAAGQSLARLSALFGANRPIIRTMPNLPAAIGEGITALIANEHVTEAQKELAQRLIGAAGLTLWITDEAQMDAITALSGSGPAYVFYLIEALAKAGAHIGLNEKDALHLARQTVIGAAALAKSAPQSAPETLRHNITSKGGTTEAALTVLMDGQFQEILNKTLTAAQNRSRELN